jgi:hypothetical protein
MREGEEKELRREERERERKKNLSFIILGILIF